MIKERVGDDILVLRLIVEWTSLTGVMMPSAVLDLDSCNTPPKLIAINPPPASLSYEPCRRVRCLSSSRMR